MAVFLSDTFSESSTTVLTSHTGEIGATWTLHPSYSGIGSINALGRLYSPTSLGYCAYASGVPSTADYSVFGVLHVASNLSNSRMGVCGRVSSSANTMYLLQYEQSQGGWRLFRLLNGSSLQLGSTAPQILTLGNSYQIELRMEGDSISAYVDGSLVIGPVTNTTITEAGFAGVRHTIGTASTGYQLDAIWATDSSLGFQSAWAVQTNKFMGGGFV